MKFFLEMIETVRSENEIKVLHCNDPEHLKCDCKEMKDTKKFFALVEKAECLVFYPKNKEPAELEGDDPFWWASGFLKPSEIKNASYDSPFAVFSYEVLGGNITSPRPEDEGLSRQWTHCVLAWEFEPNKFRYYVYGSMKVGTQYKKYVFVTHAMDRITKEFIDRINKEVVGTEAVRQRAKIGIGKEKRTHTIRRIVHIRSKKVQEDDGEYGHRKVDWTHRFVRRGAWRRKGMEGKIGKDRTGNYCVPNATWVVETVVGPEDKPLIRKTRVVGE